MVTPVRKAIAGGTGTGDSMESNSISVGQTVFTGSLSDTPVMPLYSRVFRLLARVVLTLRLCLQGPITTSKV